MNIRSRVTELKGVGQQLEGLLSDVGLANMGDVINYFPRRYDDYSQITPVAKIRPGVVTIEAEIKQATGHYVRRGMHITEAIASDQTGSVRLVWFSQPYRAASIKGGAKYFISGIFEMRRQRLSITNPSAELVSDFPINTARVVPIYKEKKGLKSSQIRKLMRQLVPLIRTLPETLPGWLVENQKLLSRARAYEMLHFPESTKLLEEAKRRLGFEEVFRLTLASLLNREDINIEQAISIPFKQRVAKEFVAHLPFQLTDDQRKVTWQAFLDMQKTRPMNRLVEGDVGSGKTVVAAMAALMVMEAGFQVVLMAPTELLARQHAETLHDLFEPLGKAHELTLLVGSMKADQKHRAKTSLKKGDARLIVGTHALLEDNVIMQKLGLVVIDEQHRFGVNQRKVLQAKAGHMPHVLSLTATPIPRSLALTLYGELDISVLAKKPGGRLPIITEIHSPNSRKQLYAKIETEIEGGRQVFVVCPLISETESTSALSAESVYERLSKNEFKHRRVGLLHGKMPTSDKRAVMQKFTAGHLDMLVTTTVIEVGVDVPNATVMLIEGAERFGLAQIHQLRGRVGRSSHQGYSYLMMSDSSAPTQRLRALQSSNDGFRLAELDLELRGPGAIYGTLQHGVLDLRMARLSDVKLIASARECAEEFIRRKEDLLKYNELAAHVQKLRVVTSLN
jgi:ATP-dependent DNA helicase RecG